MECQVRSMSDSAATGQEDVPEGRVGQVCREWLVREDGVMAYKLQHEEIEQHYDKNRFNNRVVRTDLHEAKTLQKSEEEEAELLRQAYERMLIEQEETDKQIAQRIQEQLMLEEARRHQVAEEEDQRLALQLQEKERIRLERKKREKELDRERRQVEYVHALQVSNENVKPPEAGASPDRSDDVDLTEFMLEPPPNLSQEELKRFLEDQDAELARLLQEQEAKVKSKRGGQSVRDQQMAIEAQDRELAKVLQEQERAKVKRAKEKARQKAVLLQQQEEMERIDCLQPEGKSKLLRQREANSSRSLDGSDVEQSESDQCGGHVANVAMMLDPTYTRRKNSKDFPEQPSYQGYSLGGSLDNSNTPSPLKSPSQSSAGSSPLLETLRSDYLERLGEDDDDPVPPYMPIQGQRRLGSLDKKHKKKSRDGCKTQ